IIVAFQPHRYTRTAALMADFGPALAAADRIVLTDIYSAGEPPIPGASLEALAAAVADAAPGRVDVAAGLDDLVAAVVGAGRPAWVATPRGAGRIGGGPERLLEARAR